MGMELSEDVELLDKEEENYNDYVDDTRNLASMAMESFCDAKGDPYAAADMLQKKVLDTLEAMLYSEDHYILELVKRPIRKPIREAVEAARIKWMAQTGTGESTF